MTRRKTALATKRSFDLITAGAALVMLLPVMCVIAFLIKWDDRGPIFFVQERMGRARRSFRCYKFRTLVVGAETMGFDVSADDQRMTRVGRLLRLWTLDEIPQLFNVLKGEMSIVGPRPWVAVQARCAAADSRRFAVRPGMAGWAWIHGRNRLSWDERVRLDVWYVDHWSLRLDFFILAKACVLLFRRDGIYSVESASDTPHAQIQ